MGDSPTVGDEVLGKLGELAKIPPGARPGFDRCIRVAIDELRRGMAARQPPVRRTSVLAALGEYRKSIQKVRELLSPNDCEHGLAAEYAKTVVAAFHYPGFDDAALSAFDALDCDIEKAKPVIEKRLKDKGNVHGAQGGNIAIDMFLKTLILVIQEHGGKVLTSRWALEEAKPNYIGKMLELLKPFLPPDFKYTGKTCETAGARARKLPTT